MPSPPTSGTAWANWACSTRTPGSDSSLRYDRDRKAPCYARTGIRECWIVDLNSSEVLVLRSPGAAAYQIIERRCPGERLTIGALDDVVIEVHDLFDPAPH